MGIKYNFVVQNPEKDLRRFFEFATDKTMLVKLNIEDNTKNTIIYRYYWFLEKHKKTSEMKPPFEVALNSDDGSLVYIHFFLQDGEINVVDKNILSKGDIISGFPIFDISSYDNKNYQVFEEGEFSAFSNKNNLWVLDLEQQHATYLKLNDNNFLIFDENKCLSGVIMKNLNDEEKKILKQCELLD